MKSLLLLLSAASSVLAFDERIRNVRVTTDGERIFFLTDMRLAGSGRPFHGKIFTSSTTRAETLTEFPLAVSQDQQPFHVISFDVSSDAGIIAYTGLPFCQQEPECVIPDEERGVVQTREGRILWSGFASSLRLSRNGRFALAAQPSGIFRIHLDTGSKDLLAPGLLRANIAVGDNGAALIPLGRQTAYVTPTQREIFPSAAYLTADGNTIGYRPEGSQRFLLRDMRTQSSAELPAAPISISDDAARVLYVESNALNGQANYFLLDRGTNETCPILRDPSPSQSQFGLSPDGRFTYIAGVFGVLRTACGAPLTSVVWAPASASVRASVVPGSLVRVIVNPVFNTRSADAEYPLPSQFEGFRVKLGDRFLPIERIRPYGSTQGALEVRAQAPWDLASPDPDIPIAVETPHKSPFESPSNLLPFARIVPQSPQFLIADDLSLEAVRAATLTPVTRDNPARPGETIHVFLTGLGKVDREVSTGLPAPDDPPARPLSPIQCQEFDSSGIVLAPGRAGVYRWTIRMPSSRPDNYIGLQCGEAFAVLPFLNFGQ